MTEERHPVFPEIGELFEEINVTCFNLKCKVSG